MLYFGLLDLWTVGDTRHLFSCDIPTRLPPSTTVPHPVGIVIGRGIGLGERCTILHNVTIGGTEMGEGVPRIDDDVYIGCGAAVLGDIQVGDGAVIGANAVVVSDVPAGATAVGVPAEVVDEPSD